MIKALSLLFLCLGSFVFAQAQSREELEKQRQKLKKEIAETENLLKANKAKTTENLYQWRLINNKVQLQDRVVENLSKDLNMLNNNIYLIQKDINKYDRLLDTLKQEYAKSMVYAYKNRSNYDFLNFIFSADNFNDAIKRVAYLKSYRSYREMQGQNILRTQELRKKKVAEISGAKIAKSETLKSQSSEMKTLEQQKAEQDKVVNELKKQGQQLNSQIAAKQRQVNKVNNTIAAAIKKAQDEARKAALAKAAEETRRRKEAEKEAARIAAAQAKAANTKNTSNSSPGTVSNAAPTTTTVTKSVVAVPAKEAAPKRESVLLNAENVALNSSFEKNRGSLPWPVDQGYVLMHYGSNKLPNNSTIDLTCTTIAAPIGSAVKSVFDGTVVVVQTIDDMQMVVLQHGRYFSTYSNLSNVSLSVGSTVRTGQNIGKVAPNLEGNGTVDFYMSNEKSNFNPETWLRRK